MKEKVCIANKENTSIINKIIEKHIQKRKVQVS